MSAPKRAAEAGLACKVKEGAAPRVFKAVARVALALKRPPVALAWKVVVERGWKAASRAPVLAAGFAFKVAAAPMFARLPPTRMSAPLRPMPALVPA